MRFKFVGLSCTACTRIVESKLQGKEGVGKVGVSVMTDSILVKIDPAKISEEEVERTIREVGYKIVRVDSVLR